MVKTCENCGCPLGAADIAAAQCPVCRRTIWRHVVEDDVEVRQNVEPPSKPVYQGTLLPPSHDGGGGSSADLFGRLQQDVARPADVAVAEPLARPETVAPSETDRGTRPGDATDGGAGDDRTLTATRVGIASIEPRDGQDAESDATPSSRKTDGDDKPPAASADAATRAITGRTSLEGNTRATIDPRHLGSDDWRHWSTSMAAAMEATLAATMNDAGAGPAVDECDVPDGGSPSESRYVGKTSVAPRMLTLPDQPASGGVDYAIVRPLGEGGMGVVYEATQRSINRSVALKMLKADAARRKDRRDSLATEAIVTGELTHPNIVPIHDLGQDGEGNLFYSMKRVEGSGWDRQIAAKAEVENLEIFLKVADAIAFAHSRGVVHRDLKPENVLLGGFGEVLVMDWGLASATERFSKRDSITTNTAMGGSPAYMAPEQAQAFLVSGGWRPGPLPPITPAIDIYLLGAILFEIATGKPPHEGNTPADCVVEAAENRIREVETPSGLLPIALKAMATEPSERYASVEDLQTAVREFGRNAESVALTGRAETLMHKGDLARAVVGFEDALQLWPENPQASSQVVVARRRLTRRRYALVAMTAAFLLAIGLGGFGIDYQRRLAVQANEDLEESILSETAAKDAAENSLAAAVFSEKLARKNRVMSMIARWRADRSTRQEAKAKIVAERQRDDARVARAEADRERERQRYQNYQGRIKLIDARIEENAFAEADRLLEELASDSPDLCGWEWGRLKYLCTQGRRTLETPAPVSVAAVTADGSRILTGGRDGRLRMWDRMEVTADGDGKTTPVTAVDIDAVTDSERRIDWPHVGFRRVTAIAVTSDGRLFAAAGEGVAGVLLFRKGTQEAVHLDASGFAAASVALGFSSDGTRLLSAGTDGLIVWDTASGRPLGLRAASASAGSLPLTCAAMAPDGRRVAAGFADGQVLYWQEHDDSRLFDEPRVFDGHRAGAVFGDGFHFTAGAVTAIAFLPDGSDVVSGGDDGRLLRWNAAATVPQDDDRDLAAAFATAVEASRGDRTSTAAAPAGIAEIVAHAGPISTLSTRSDGDGGATVVTGGQDGLIKIWNGVSDWPAGRFQAQPAVVLRGHEGRIDAVAGFAPDGAGLRIFSAGADETARLWNVAHYDEVQELRPRVFADHEQEILSAALDPAGQRLLTAGRDERLVVTDLADPAATPRRSEKVHSEAISVPWIVPFRDGRRLATGYLDGSFAIWDIAARTTLARVTPALGSSLTPPAVSPDGRWIAAARRSSADDRAIAVWSVDELTQPTAGSGEPRLVFEPRGEIFAAVFTSDGKLVFGDRPGPNRPAGGYVYVADLDTQSLTTHRIFGDGVEGRVYGLEALPDGGVLAAGSPAVGSAVRVLRLNPVTGTAGETVVSLAGSFLSNLAIAHDGSAFAAVSNVGNEGAQAVECFDLASGRRRWDMSLEDRRITALDASPDGRSLLTVSESIRRDEGKVVATGDSEGRLLDLATGEERRFGPDENEPWLTAAALSRRVSSASFSRDGQRVYLASIRGVSEWDVDRRVRLPGAFDSHGAIAVAGFSSDGRYIVDGHRDGSFDIRDASTAQLRPVFHQPRDDDRSHGSVAAAVFSPRPGSQKILVASTGSVRLWEFDAETRTASIVRTFLEGDEAQSLLVSAVAFSHDERHVAAACRDGAVRLWAIDHETPPLVLKSDRAAGVVGHSGSVTAVAFPHMAVREGFLVVASGSSDHGIVVWIVDMRTNQIAAAVPLNGHRDAVTRLFFMPDRNDSLISASSDGTAKLWDWDRGGLSDWTPAEFARLDETQEVLTLEGRHTAGLTAVDVARDGQMILTAGRDGRAILWPAVRPPGTNQNEL